MFSPDVGGAIPGALHGAAWCLQHSSHVTVTEIEFKLVYRMYTFIYLFNQSQTELSHKQDSPLQNLKFTKNTFPAQYNYAVQVQQCEIVPLNKHNTHSLLLHIFRFLWQCVWGLWDMTSCYWVLFPVFWKQTMPSEH